MAKIVKLNIDEVEIEYVHGKMSYNDLAIKYRCSETYVANIGKERNWYAKRLEHRKLMKEEIKSTVKQMVGQEIAVIKTQHYNRTEKLLKLVDKKIECAEKTMKNGKAEYVKTTDLERLINVITTAQAEQRICLDVDNDSVRTDNDSRRTAVQEAKLEIDRMKIFGLDDEELPDTGFAEASKIEGDPDKFVQEALESGDIDLG